MPQYISKLILNGVTQMDVTQDTVAASNLLSGETATGADGAPVVGTLDVGSTYTATVVESNITSSIPGIIYIQYNSQIYRLLDESFTFHAGDTAEIKAVGIRGGGSIYIDDTLVASDTFESVTYTYTLPNHDINIRFSYSSYGSVYVDFPTIAVNTNGKHDVLDYVYADVNVPSGGSSTYSLTNIVPTQTIATTTSNLYGYVGLISTYTAYVQSGEWYLVTYDNTEYVCTGYYGANSEVLVGDYQLITSNVEWLETPFMVEHNLTNGYYFLGSRVSGNHTLKVDKITLY